jgi:hypothetical protein
VEVARGARRAVAPLARHDARLHGDVCALLEARAAAPREKLPRAELLARIERAQANPRLAEPVSVMFRNRKAEEAGDEELEALVVEIEALADHED